MAEREVLSSLPRSRPQRRSTKRAGAAASKEGATTPKKAPAAAKPKAKRSSPAKARTTAKPKARTSPAASRARAAAPPPPPRPAREEQATPVEPPSRTDLVQTAVTAAGELAKTGLSAYAGALRGIAKRIPRP